MRVSHVVVSTTKLARLPQPRVHGTKSLSLLRKRTSSDTHGVAARKLLLSYDCGPSYTAYGAVRKAGV